MNPVVKPKYRGLAVLACIAALLAASGCDKIAPAKPKTPETMGSTSAPVQPSAR